MMKKYLSYLTAALLFTACSSQTLVLSIPNTAIEDAYIESNLESSIDFDSQMLLQKHAVVMTVDVTGQAPKELLAQTHDQLLAELQKQELIPTILPESHFKKTIAENRSMKVPSNLYLEAISELGISNRDIARPLGKLLKTKSFFLLQLDLWPCPECANKNRIRLKVRYIDAHKGDIIWSGLGQRSLYDHELEQKEEILKLLVHTIAADFKAKYTTKWHKSRIKNLAK